MAPPPRVITINSQDTYIYVPKVFSIVLNMSDVDGWCSASSAVVAVAVAGNG